MQTALDILWGMQYASAFIIWLLVIILSISKILKEGTQSFYWYCIFTAIYYILLQTHWILFESIKHVAWTEIAWSLFESSVGSIVLYAVTRHKQEKELLIDSELIANIESNNG